MNGKKIRLITEIFAIIVICLVAFGGVYVQNRSIMENKVKVGKIVNTVVDESVLTDGKVDPAKMEAIVYEPVTHKYLLAAEAVGQAFHDGLQLK